MSSYFDKRNSAINENPDDVVSIENEVAKQVEYVVGDVHFPDDLRKKAIQIISIYQIDNLAGSKAGKEYFEAVKCSRMLQELHQLFHEVASRQIKTPYGFITDKPDSILKARGLL